MIKLIRVVKTYWNRAKEATGLGFPEFEEDGEEEQDDGDEIENDEFEIKEGEKTKKGEQDDYNTSSEADNIISTLQGFTPVVSELEGESNVETKHGLAQESEVEDVKVGKVMGFKMDRCEDNIMEIIESQGAARVNFVGLQETKMESMEVSFVKQCWGNFSFEYVHSDFMGNSGGNVCIWDPNSFCRSSSTVSDYFVIIRGTWLKNGKNLLVIVVYAPQDAKEKSILWEYLTYVSNKWAGDVVIMGDFNEVRLQADRFGSVFSQREANRFNDFINKAGLEESMGRYLNKLDKRVLGGCSIQLFQTPYGAANGYNRSSCYTRLITGNEGGIGCRSKFKSQSNWLSIIEEAASLKEKGINFFEFVHHKLGNGESTKFWEDKWSEGELKQKQKVGGLVKSFFLSPAWIPLFVRCGNVDYMEDTVRRMKSWMEFDSDIPQLKDHVHRSLLHFLVVDMEHA
ncbi:RNA-directed DNA polymerase, eukaryota [Tanacetum coccineum]